MRESINQQLILVIIGRICQGVYESEFRKELVRWQEERELRQFEVWGFVGWNFIF